MRPILVFFLMLTMTSQALAGDFVRLMTPKNAPVYVDPGEVKLIVSKGYRNHTLYISDAMVKIKVVNVDDLLKARGR